MKKNFLLLNVFLFCAIGFGMQSCQYNACKARAVECENGGVCDRGDCQCVLGYEGEFCEDKVNDKFASHYAMVKTELINSTPPAFDDDDTLFVYADNLDRNVVYFYSIRDSAVVIDGQVRENALTIPLQTVLTTTYRGEGSLNGDKLTITMTKTDNLNATTSQITYVGKKYETF
jgi:hypothetical protein